MKPAPRRGALIQRRRLNAANLANRAICALNFPATLGLIKRERPPAFAGFGVFKKK